MFNIKYRQKQNIELKYDESTHEIDIVKKTQKSSWIQSLEKSKVVYDIAVLGIFTIIGLLLSYQANIILNQANTIMTRQSELQEALAKPIVNLEASFNAEGIFEKVTVNNSGAIIKDFEVKLYPYLLSSITYASDKEPPKYNKVMVPLSRVIASSKNNIFKFNTLNTRSGDIGTIEVNESSRQFLEQILDCVYSDYPHIIELNNHTVSSISIEMYINVTYYDVLGNKSSDVYQCITGYSSSCTGKKSWKNIRADEGEDFATALFVRELDTSLSKNQIKYVEENDPNYAKIFNVSNDSHDKPNTVFLKEFYELIINSGYGGLDWNVQNQRLPIIEEQFDILYQTIMCALKSGELEHVSPK